MDADSEELIEELNGDTVAGRVYFNVLEGVETGEEAYEEDAESGNGFCFCGLAYSHKFSGLELLEHTGTYVRYRASKRELFLRGWC